MSEKRRVLIVDDHRDSAESLALLLGLLGNETRAAHDGLEALQVAEEFRPHATILDISLPRMNGYDVARNIRQAEWGKGMLLVALSGWGRGEDKQKAMEVGFDRQLTKPVEIEALEALLAEAPK